MSNKSTENGAQPEGKEQASSPSPDEIRQPGHVNRQHVVRSAECLIIPVSILAVSQTFYELCVCVWVLQGESSSSSGSEDSDSAGKGSDTESQEELFFTS